MNNVLDTEVEKLFQKHNIPKELIEILADDAIRITLDDRSAMERGLTFSSNDDGKLFAITRCIEKLRRINTLYSKPLDDDGCISYANNPKDALRKRKKEQVIDLDNIDIEEEKRKSIFRYADTFIENRRTIDDLNAEISQMSRSYVQLNDINTQINKMNKSLDYYKAKVTEIEISPIPNIFRYRKLKNYTKKVRNYMSQIDRAQKLKKKAEECCKKVDPLVIPRKSRVQKITAYNGIINNRMGELLRKYRIKPEELKKYILETLDGESIPEILSLLPKEKEDRRNRGR